MTQAERIFLAVLVPGLIGALLLPVEVVETGIAIQVGVLAIIAIAAGAYIWRVNKTLSARVSAYLWLLVRRDLRITAAFVMLGILAAAALLPRVFEWAPVISRPWGTVWLVIAIDLLAIGLIDDALVMRADRAIHDAADATIAATAAAVAAEEQEGSPIA